MEWAQVLRRQVQVKKTSMILKPVMLGHLGFPLALLFGLKTQQHLIDCVGNTALLALGEGLQRWSAESIPMALVHLFFRRGHGL